MEVSPHLCKKERDMDFIEKKIELLYPGIYEVREDFGDNEAEEYMEYCEQTTPRYKTYQAFKMFREVKEQCRTKGLESVIFRQDVLGVEKCHYHYIKVDTVYGSFRYTKDRKLL